MDLEEFKKKAGDIKENLEPKVKGKAKRAKKKVSEFVDEHFGKNRDDAKEPETKDIVDAEYRDVTDILNEEDSNSQDHADSGDEGVSGADGFEEIFRESNADEASADTSENGDDGKNADESPEDKTDEKDEESENTRETESEIEKIEGVVVGTMKDKYNQFKTNVLPKVKNVASNVGSKVKDAASEIAPKAKETAENLGGKVKETAIELGPKAKEVAENLGGKVKETAVELGPKAKEVAENLGGKVKETAIELGPKAKEAAEKIGNKVKQTAQEFGPKARDTMVDTAKQMGPKMFEGAKKAGDTISFQGYRLRKSLGKKMRKSIRKKLGLREDDDSDGIKYYEVKKKKTNRLVAHARTVITHRHLVLKHCVKAGIPVQGLLHDLSKFSPSEFYYGVKFFSGDRSPNEGEREDHGFSYAWMHHKGRNKHHFEYWNDYNIVANKALPVKMPLKYVIEMFCDRVAASKVYLKGQYTNKSPYEYFDKGRSRRTIHQETSDFLEKLLKMLAEKGEPYTFLYIRWYMKHHKDY